MPELEVFSEYFGELVTSLECCCLEISNKCVSKNLISVSTHKGILFSSGSTGTEKTTKLLDGIRSSLTHQRECFHKFVEILKDQLIFQELIGRMEKSLRETKERKVTAECTDKLHLPRQKDSFGSKLNLLKYFTGNKEPSPEAAQTPTAEVSIEEVRRTVIKSYLKQISPVVQARVVTLASKSRTSELISSDVYKRIVRSKQPKDKQTRILLLSICKRVRVGDKSGEKFEIFLDLLEGCPGGKNLVVDIRTTISRQLVEQQPTPPPTAPVQCAQPQENPSKDRPNQPVSHSGEDESSAMILGSGKTVDTKVLNPAVDPQKESEYFATQDRKQNEEKIRELTEDLSKNQVQLGVASQEKVKLEEQLTEKEREVTELENELETLRLAENTLRLRFADSEKKAAEIKQITTAISELEMKISHVSGERKEIRTRMVVFEEKIQSIHTGQLETKQEMRDIQTTLLKMQVSFEEAHTPEVHFVHRHTGKLLSALASVICILVAFLVFNLVTGGYCHM